MTHSERKLEAPHRRLESTPPRFVEKAAVIGYRSMSAALAHLPPRATIAVIGSINQLSLPGLAGEAVVLQRQLRPRAGAAAEPPPRVADGAPGLPRVRAVHGGADAPARRSPQAEIAALVDGDGIERIAGAWQAHGKAMIVCAGHVGNNEAVAAGIASRGYPANVVADDSAFPEIFEILRAQRESWGVHVIPWRNLRELFTVLRRNEILALLVDWGYRDDGIPVRLFGAWTTLPAGPAVLAAKTGALIAPMAIRRTHDGHFRVESGEVFTVPSSDPADIQRATQRIADALEQTIANGAVAVVQLQADLAGDRRRGGRSGAPRGRDARRAAGHVGRARDAPGGPRRVTAPADQPDPAAPGPPAGVRTVRGSAILAGAQVLGRLPEAPLVAAAESIGELWYRAAPQRAAQARANLGRVCEGLAAQARGPSLVRRAATDPDALERIVRATFRHAARYYLEVARAGSQDAAHVLARIDIETPDEVRAALRSGRPVILSGMHYGSIEVPVVVVSDWVGHAVTAPMETVADAGLRRWFEASRRRVGVNVVPATDARRSLMAAIRRGESVGMVADRDLLHNGIMVPFFGHPAPLPAGPALLAIETGLPIYVGSARWAEHGRYRGKLLQVPVAAEGRLRARVTATTAAMAAAFETLLADGPEQWWGAFHPIWPDLEVGRQSNGTGDAQGAAA